MQPYVSWDAVSLSVALVGGLGTGVAAASLFYVLLEAVLQSAPVQMVRSFFGFCLSNSRLSNEGMPLAVRRFLMERESGYEAVPVQVRDWVRKTAQRIRKAHVSVAIGRYLLGVVIAALVGLFLGILWFKNLPAAVALCLAAFFVPDSILLSRIQARRNRMIEQMSTAIRIFAAEYSETPQVGPALARTASRLAAPLGPVFRRAAARLLGGIDREEVLMELMDALDFEYGRMFVHLLRLAFEDSAVGPLFTRLAVKVESLQALMHKNSAELSYNRFIGLLLNALIVPTYLLVVVFVPGAAAFLIRHPIGRFLVFVSILSWLLGLTLDRILSEVEA